MSPLRVAVTRDEGPDGTLSHALRRRGLEPVWCPVVAETPAPDPAALVRAARRLERYDWLVVASSRAVAALLAARGGRALPSRLRCAAVGSKTAALLAAHGARASLTAGEAGARALLDTLRHADRWPGRRVLLPRAAEGGRELGGGLRAFGARVDEVVAYCTVARPPAEVAAAWEAARADAAVVASPSAARSLVAGIGAAALCRLACVVAIGRTTAAVLAALGVESRVPATADFDAVAELLGGALVAPGKDPSP